MTAQSAAEALKAAIPEIAKIVEVKEDNDPNKGMLRRPNGYVAASVLYDSRVTCPELGMDCGAMIEQWPNQAAAQRHSDYIQSVRGSMPTLGQEWTTVGGNLLLRVAGDLKPSVAKEHEAAFTRDQGETISAGAANPPNTTPAPNSEESTGGQVALTRYPVPHRAMPPQRMSSTQGGAKTSLVT